MCSACVRCVLAFAEQGHSLSASAPPARRRPASLAGGLQPRHLCRPGLRPASWTEVSLCPEKGRRRLLSWLQRGAAFPELHKEAPPFPGPRASRGLGGASLQRPGAEWHPAPWPPDDGRVRCPMRQGLRMSSALFLLSLDSAPQVCLGSAEPLVNGCIRTPTAGLVSHLSSSSLLGPAVTMLQSDFVSMGTGVCG